MTADPKPKPVRHYKDKRTWNQPYRKSRRWDTSCRCHGGCGYCQDNREYRWKKRVEMLERVR